MSKDNPDRDDVDEWNKGSNTVKSDGHISIYSGGVISIPDQVYEKHFAGEEGAILKYSNDTDEIGIVPASNDHPNSYSLSGRSHQISCKSYLKHYNLLRDESYKLPISDSNGCIWIDTTVDDKNDRKH